MLARTLVLAALLASPSLAQTVDDGAALGGPRVVAPEKVATITEREMDGSLKKLDARPEQAAIALLDLTPEEKTAVDAILDKRAVAVGSLLAEHQALFLKIQQARQGNASREEIAPLMREFRPIAAPLVSPALLDQLAGVLPVEKASKLRSLVGEYMQALAAEGTKAGRGPANPPTDTARRRRANADDAPAAPAANPPAITERMEINLLLHEMGRSLNAVVEERRAHSAELMKAIEATPEQEEQIRAIVRGAGDNAGLRPTREQRTEMRRKIMAILTPEQQKKFNEFQRQ